MRSILAVVVLFSATAAFAQTPLKQLTGKYLNYDNESSCAVTIDVKLEAYNAGSFLSVGSTIYVIPNQSSFGRPSDRNGDLFTVSYGPGPGASDVPKCSESADFRFGHLQTTRQCEGASLQTCFFAKPHSSL